MLKEFKEFVSRGNVFDLSIGVVVGAAFGKIASSVVNDVLMPPIGMLLGDIDFKDLFVNLSHGGYKTLAAARAAGAPVIGYGMFLNTIMEFLLISFSIFVLVRVANRFRFVPVPVTQECVFCRSKISPDAIRCPQCTSDLIANEARQDTTVRVESHQRRLEPRLVP